eukprot:CAMPEP_0206223476 /NCGR_PEP_ID=MMETSP0047_2-20121206/6505_1 /ASSEMBLY_ACC=CAM_ASM_000192 /TAXON_ID=195065 /ORGANISM="Chroomonas mesostigmatica_cf, Strain CCMP1168" /LENGTH=141 /DNA_ID=CAMNT_0053646353 /DNA_START=48 /DNA_END=473 /DNA_ORIENTATION=+
MSYGAGGGRSRSRSPRRDPPGGGGPPPRSFEGGGGGGGGDNDGSKLYVGNLSFQTNSEDLRQYFGTFGKVEDAQVIMDRDDPGRSRGFGFVTFSTREDADYAISKTDNIEWMGRSIRVNVSKGRSEGGFRGGRGGGGPPRG